MPHETMFHLSSLVIAAVVVGIIVWSVSSVQKNRKKY